MLEASLPATEATEPRDDLPKPPGTQKETPPQREEKHPSPNPVSTPTPEAVSTEEEEEETTEVEPKKKEACWSPSSSGSLLQQ